MSIDNLIDDALENLPEAIAARRGFRRGKKQSTIPRSTSMAACSSLMWCGAGCTILCRIKSHLAVMAWLVPTSKSAKGGTANSRCCPIDLPQFMEIADGSASRKGATDDAPQVVAHRRESLAIRVKKLMQAS
jgi:hypothetical protein